MLGMAKAAFLTFAVLLWSCSARADENLDLKIAGNLLLLADWNQTRQIARHPKSYYEYNPVLGKHPSTRRVDIYFAAALAALNGLDLLLDDGLGDALWVGVTVIEIDSVSQNLGIGLKVKF